MPYLVDGHNLVPKLGLRLDSPDDEQSVISILQEFSRLRRAQVQVFFDGAPHGQQPVRKIGMLTVHFVRRESSADAAIEIELSHLGKGARNWTVVSSDARVQHAAAAAHAEFISSEQFAAEISRVRAISASQSKKPATLAPGELDEWLELFNHKKG